MHPRKVGEECQQFCILLCFFYYLCHLTFGEIPKLWVKENIVVPHSLIWVATGKLLTRLCETGTISQLSNFETLVGGK